MSEWVNANKVTATFSINCYVIVIFVRLCVYAISIARSLLQTAGVVSSFERNRRLFSENYYVKNQMKLSLSLVVFKIG